jgi:murein DD-endopeptidase MepM/ murein hydrolase activator NlpD
MASRAATVGAARSRRPERRDVARRRRVALVSLIAAAALVTALLIVFVTDGGSRKPAADPATSSATATGAPAPFVVALQGPLRIQIPIAQTKVTAIAYHGGRSDALALTPLGRRAHEGFLSSTFHRLFGTGRTGLRYFQLSGGSGPDTGAVDIGAPAGTDVYAPVDGTVVALTPIVLNGKTYGARIDIQPTGSPSIVVSVSRLEPDPSLTVGSAVESGASKLGVLVDFAGVERQSLARFSHDAGNHASVEVRPAATLPLR